MKKSLLFLSFATILASPVAASEASDPNKLFFSPEYRVSKDQRQLWSAKNEVDFRGDDLWKSVADKVKNRQFAEAIPLLTQLIEQQTRAAEAYSVRAFCYYELGNGSAALSDAKQALTMDRNLALGWRVRGWCEFDQQNYSEAINSLTAAITLNPKDAYSLYIRGNCRLKTNEPLKAIEDATAALLLDPKLYGGYVVRCNANLQLKRWELAQKDAKAMIQLDPDGPEGYVGHGRALKELGKGYYAVPELQKALVCYKTWADLRRKNYDLQINQLSSEILDLAPIYQFGSSKIPTSPSADLTVKKPEFRSFVVEQLPPYMRSLNKTQQNKWVMKNKWKPGTTLKVAFNGGHPQYRKLVADTATQWSKAANINFDFGYDQKTGQYRNWSTDDADYAAHIRVRFDSEDGLWSAMGTDSIAPSQCRPNEASMNLGLDREPVDRRKTDILHEFGHAIGFAHEHQHPKGACNDEFRWEDESGYELTWFLDPRAKAHEVSYLPDVQERKPGVYLYFFGEPNCWMPGVVDFNLKEIEPSSAYSLGPVDRKSIMHYYHEPFLFKKGTESPCYIEAEATDLSDLDKQGVANAYGPRSTQEASGN